MQQRWNVEALYSPKEWNEEFSRVVTQVELKRENLAVGLGICRRVLESYFDRRRLLEKLYTYAHLRHDENLANDENKARFQKISNFLHDFAAATAWIEPEILALPKDQLKGYCEELEEMRFYLEQLLRRKQHTLSPREEELVALSGRALATAHQAFSQMTNADFRFGKVKEHELTQGSYGLLMRSEDRSLRKSVFEKLHGHYSAYENSLCELLNGQVQTHLFDARAHHFTSALEASLFPKRIDTSVYKQLIQTVRSKLPVLHRYMKLRKEVLGVSELHLYDVYAPLFPAIDRSYSYEEAAQTVIESVAPLGGDYQTRLAKGLTKERWVDVYENVGKRSGAYSSGCYDSMPYILMNYKGHLRDVYTLAHEAGHSMHSYLARKHQPYVYADYTLFVAEVASTFNEDLLFQHLLAQSEDRAYLVSEKLDDIRATLFRQTMFAEFELMLHEMAEQGEPITPKVLRERYHQLNQDYFGPDVVIDPEIDIEWARIPHFYYNYYVYQYATGISAALALSEKVQKGGASERGEYLTFLKSGGSKYSLDLLKDAGVDMTTPEPVLAAIDRFDDLVTNLGYIILQRESSG